VLFRALRPNEIEVEWAGAWGRKSENRTVKLELQRATASGWHGGQNNALVDGEIFAVISGLLVTCKPQNPFHQIRRHHQVRARRTLVVSFRPAPAEPGVRAHGKGQFQLPWDPRGPPVNPSARPGDLINSSDARNKPVKDFVVGECSQGSGVGILNSVHVQ
jgi:hypothetical protein